MLEKILAMASKDQKKYIHDREEMKKRIDQTKKAIEESLNNDDGNSEKIKQLARSMLKEITNG